MKGKPEPNLTEAFKFAKREGLEFLPLRTKGQGAGKAPTEEGWAAKKYAETDIPPGANLGYKCGPQSGGLVVLDFDVPEHYATVFNPEKIEGDTTVVQTSRGVHAYFKVAGGFRSRAFKMRKEGIEFTFSIQAEGKIVVAPGSIHPEGLVYKFKANNPIAHATKEDMESLIARAEDKALELGYEIVNGQEPIDVQATLASPPRDGQGSDDATFRIATFARMAGRPKAEVQAILVEWWKGSPDFNSTTPGWVAQKVASAFKPPLPYRYKFVQNPGQARVDGGRLVFSAKPKRKVKGSRDKKNPEQDQEARYATTVELPGGQYAEEIYRGREIFVVFDPKTGEISETGSLLLADGTIVRPAPVDEKLQLALTLPDGVEEYGNLYELRKEMLGFALEEYDPVDNLDLYRLCIHLFLASWVAPLWQARMAERFIPLICARGPSETGKKRFLTVARWLTYRPLYGLKTTKVPSLFRAINPWGGTLVLDEADIADSSLVSELVQFLNSRADGIPIPRFSSENNNMSWFYSFGMTVLATRKPFSDDGLESRAVVFPAEGTNTPEKINLLPPPAWVERGRKLQRKLLMFRFRHLGGQVPSQLLIDGVSGFRVRESLLCLQALKDEDPDMVEDLTAIAKKLEARLIQERAASPEGLILNYVYSVLEGDADFEPWHNGHMIIMRKEIRVEGRMEEERTPLTLRTTAESQGKAFSSSEIGRYWRGFGQALRTQGRFDGKKYRGMLLITNPRRLAKEFRKYVPDAEDILGDIGQKHLDEGGGIGGGGTSGTSGTPPSEGAPHVPVVPADTCGLPQETPRPESRDPPRPPTLHRPGDGLLREGDDLGQA